MEFQILIKIKILKEYFSCIVLYRMGWSDEVKIYFVTLLRDNKELLFGDYSPIVTKVARNTKWQEIADLLTARGAVFKDVRSLRKVCCI